MDICGACGMEIRDNVPVSFRTENECRCSASFGMSGLRATDTVQQPRGYTYDPLGNPIPDPSGVAEGSGFETTPADFGRDAVQAGVDTAAAGINALTRGLKLILYGALGIAGVALLAELNNAGLLPHRERKRR